MNAWRALLSTAAACLLTACTSPVNLALGEAPRVRTQRSPTSAARQSLVFAPTVDLRPEYQRPGVGRIGGRDVASADLLGWIDRALGQLQGSHFSACETVEPGAWRVTPRLRHFYTAGLAVTKNANVVLELEIHPPTGNAVTRVYRGRVNAMNWWNSAGEIEASVINALGDCLERMARDLDTLTQSNSGNSTTKSTAIAG